MRERERISEENYRTVRLTDTGLTGDLDLTGPLGGPVQDNLLRGLQVGEVSAGLDVEDRPAM